MPFQTWWIIAPYKPPVRLNSKALVESWTRDSKNGTWASYFLPIPSREGSSWQVACRALAPPLQARKRHCHFHLHRRQVTKGTNISSWYSTKHGHGHCKDFGLDPKVTLQKWKPFLQTFPTVPYKCSPLPLMFHSSWEQISGGAGSFRRWEQWGRSNPQAGFHPQFFESDSED